MTQMQTSFAQTLARLAVLPETKDVLTAFLDVATTSHGRATHYNTRAEQQAAEMSAHDRLLELDRSVYAAFLTLPGLSDRSVQVGTRNALVSAQTTSASVLRVQILPGSLRIDRELGRHYRPRSPSVLVALNK